MITAMSFQDFSLVDPIVHGAQRMGYVEPSPVQQEAIPIALQGKDMIVSAQTGTGKTAAFGLPLLSQLYRATQGGTLPPRVRALVLGPTRELVLQVGEAFREFSFFTNLSLTILYGGVGYGKQKEELLQGVDTVVATPGRLLDLLDQGLLKFDQIEFLVLDEVDRMLDMGFLPAVRRIIQLCPKKRQTLFFSATIPREIESLAHWCLEDPQKISIGQQCSTAEKVDHAFYPVASDQKVALLQALLKKGEDGMTLIFCRTKDGADRVASYLEQEGHQVGVLHSNRSQTERIDALEGFKQGRYRLMVATDIAARGIDIAGVSHVINYDVPQHAEDYVHRIGRTGRANRSGDAWTIMTVEDLPYVKAIESFIQEKVPRKKLDDFNYFFTTLFQEEKAEKLLRNLSGARTLKGYRYGARSSRRKK